MNTGVRTEDWADRLHAGLIPAVPVPLDAAGRIHRAGQESYVEHMAGQPVCGVAVWAHTGRGLHLEVPQREEVLRSWRSGLTDGRCVVAGVGANAEREKQPEKYQRAAVRMAESALSLGADALLVYPPTLYRDTAQRDGKIVEYHRALAALDAPLILFYLYEAAGGISYEPAVLSELLALPQVIGIKMATLDSVMTFQDVARQIRAEQPRKILITGEDRFLGYSLMCGAGAALIGMGAACSALQSKLIRSYFQEDASRFLALSAKADLLARHTFIAPMEGYILRMLWVLVHQEVLPIEAANDPWGPRLSPQEFDGIGAALREIGEVAKSE